MLLKVADKIILKKMVRLKDSNHESQLQVFVVFCMMVGQQLQTKFGNMIEPTDGRMIQSGHQNGMQQQPMQAYSITVQSIMQIQICFTQRIQMGLGDLDLLNILERIVYQVKTISVSQYQTIQQQVLKKENCQS